MTDKEDILKDGLSDDMLDTPVPRTQKKLLLPRTRKKYLRTREVKQEEIPVTRTQKKFQYLR